MNIDDIANGIVYQDGEKELIKLAKTYGKSDIAPGDVVKVKGFNGEWKLLTAMIWGYGEEKYRSSDHVVLLKNKKIYKNITMKKILKAIAETTEYYSKIKIPTNDPNQSIDLNKMMNDRITVPITWIEKINE